MNQYFLFFDYNSIVMKRFLQIGLLLFTISFSYAQDWTALNGPFGGRVNDILTLPSGTMLSATSSGVFRSTNSGTNWTKVSSELTNNNYYPDLEYDGTTTVYAITYNALFKSTDEGLTFSVVNSSAFSGASKLKRAPNGNIFVAVNQQLLRSTDNGVTFAQTSLNAVGSIVDIAINSLNQIFVSAYGQGIFRSIDNGTNWTDADQSPFTGFPAINSFYSYRVTIANDVIYALTNLGPYKLSGSAWSLVKGSMPEASFAGLLDASGSTLYLFNSNFSKFYSSTNAGVTWSVTGLNFPYSNFSVNCLSVKSATEFYIGLGELGLFKTTDAGSSWNTAQSGIKAFYPYDIFEAPNGRLFQSYSGLGFYQSIDNGVSWDLNITGTNLNRYIDGFAKLADNSILAFGNGVLRSTDNGNTWAVKNAVEFMTNLETSDGANLFYFTGTTIKKSTDQGATWATLPITGLPSVYSVTKIQIDGSNNIYLLLYNSSGGSVNQLWKVNTSNAASQLTAVPNGVRDFQVSNSTIYSLNTTTSLGRSADGGSTFTTKTIPAANAASALWVYSDAVIFTQGNNSSAFHYTYDGGATWSNHPLLDASARVNDMLVSSVAGSSFQYAYLATSYSATHKSVNSIIPAAAPTALTVIGKTYDAVNILWTDNANNETDYVVEYSEDNNTAYKKYTNYGSNIDIASGNIQGKGWVNLGGLTKNKTYFFRVGAINGAGTFYSNEISVTTPDQCVSSIPDNRSWTATAVADAGYTANGSGPFTSNIVKIFAIANSPNQYTLSDYTFNMVPTSIYPAMSVPSLNIKENCGETFFTYSPDQNVSNMENANGIWNPTTKTLTVKWRSTLDFYDDFRATTTYVLNATDPVPAVPTLNVFAYSGTEAFLNWNVVGFETQYLIERSSSPTGPFTSVATVSYPTVTYIDKNLTAGNYYYQIKTKNASGISAASPVQLINIGATLFRPVENDIQLNFESQQGVSWGDLDNDGDEDIASPSFQNASLQAVPPVFYENLGNGKDFTRKTISALANENTSISRGINIFDFNNDGKLDMYITRSTESSYSDLLLINQGSWNFTKTIVGPTLGYNVAFRASSIADYDNDGFADIYISQSDAFSNPLRNILLKNTAGNSLTEITTGSFVTDTNESREVSFADYDNDGDLDCFVTTTTTSQFNKLYKNTNGEFAAVTGLIFDTDVIRTSRTTSWGDIDNDGDLDLYVGSSYTTVSNPTAIANGTDRLYRNNGNGTFTRITSSVAEETGTGTFGSAFGDIDNDGDLDLIAVNTGANSIFLNDGTGIFTKYNGSEMINHPNISETGVSMADYDKDGFLDIYPAKNTSTTEVVLPNLLYRNTSVASASKNWIEIKLTGTTSNKAAIGARVKVVTTSPARSQIREVSGRTGYGSQNSLIQHFGLGTATVASQIVVTWPSGVVQTANNVAVNKIIEIIEDVTGPAPVTFVPAHSSTGAAINTKLEINFDETPVGVAGKKVNVSIGTSTAFSFNATDGIVNGKTISFTPPAALSFFTVYTVNAEAGAFQDIYGNNAAALTWTFTSLDNIAPVITFDPASVKLDSRFVSTQLPATIQDNNTVSSASIWYRPIGGGSFVEHLGVFDAGAAKWNLPVDQALIDGNGMEYYITAKDPANNTARVPATSTETLYAYLNFKAADNVLRSDRIGFGGTSTSWKIFTIPLDLGTNNGVSIVLDELNGLNAINKSDWRMLTYKDDKAWGEFPVDFSSFARGKGYFINIRNPVSILMPEANVFASNRKNLYQMVLKKGWNQIGNPYNTPVSWNDVATLNSLTGKAASLTKFTSGTYSSTSADLQPFEGGFVFVENDITVSIPFAGQTATGGRTAATNTELHLDSWMNPISILQNGVEYSYSGIGMNKNASVSFDDFDDINPPRFLDYAEINFDHPEFFAKRFSRDVVPTQDKYTWTFAVASSNEGNAELKWDNSKFGESSKDLFLFDISLQKPINMREESTYSFDPKKSSQFRVYFGDNLKAEIKPDRLMLGAASPNPASRNVTIPLTLPASANNYQVRLEVFNLMGKKIETLVNGELAPGFYEIPWTVSDELISGLYTYRLVVGANQKKEVRSGKIIISR